MNDRELLEMAAKAAGIKPEGYGVNGVATRKNGPCLVGWWNPINDDGDAFRLAVKINEVRMFIYPNEVSMGCLEIVEKYAGDPMPAARRAIVRAAAEIGKAMP